MTSRNLFSHEDIIHLESIGITVATNTPDTAIVIIGPDDITITYNQDHYLCDCDTHQSKQSLLESLYAEHLVLVGWVS